MYVVKLNKLRRPIGLPEPLTFEQAVELSRTAEYMVLDMAEVGPEHLHYLFVDGVVRQYDPRTNRSY